MMPGELFWFCAKPWTFMIAVLGAELFWAAYFVISFVMMILILRTEGTRWTLRTLTEEWEDRDNEDRAYAILFAALLFFFWWAAVVWYIVKWFFAIFGAILSRIMRASVKAADKAIPEVRIKISKED